VGSWRSTEHSWFGFFDRRLRPTLSGGCGLLLDPQCSVVDGRGHSRRFAVPRVDPGPPGDTARTTPHMDRRPSVASPRSGVLLVSLSCGSMSPASHTPTLSNQSQKPSQTSRRTARKPVAEPRKPIRHQGFFELPTNRKEPASHSLLSALEGYRQDYWRATSRVLAILLRGCQPNM
jgi:hypothetical protein